MRDLVQFLVNALSLGGVYALTTLGLVIVFGIMRLINFAYGELIMVAGYALFVLTTLNVPWLLAAVISVVASVVGALLMERIGFRPLRDANPTTLLITSFAISSFLQNVALVYITPLPQPINMPNLFVENFAVGTVLIPKLKVLSIVVTITVLVILTLVLKRTNMGLALLAAAEDFTTTRLMGIDANAIVATAFAIEGFIAGVVMLLWIGDSALVFPTIGLTPVLIAFMAGVVGGMRSLIGAVIGGFLVGFVFTSLATWLPLWLQNYRQGLLFTTVVVILLFRPQGLIRGSYREEER